MAGDVKCPVCGSSLTYEKRFHPQRHVITMEARAALPGLLKKPGAAV